MNKLMDVVPSGESDGEGAPRPQVTTQRMWVTPERSTARLTKTLPLGSQLPVDVRHAIGDSRPPGVEARVQPVPAAPVLEARAQPVPAAPVIEVWARPEHADRVEAFTPGVPPAPVSEGPRDSGLSNIHEEHSGLFREAAVRARYGEPEVRKLPVVLPSRWSTLGLLLSLLVLLLAAACFGRVEITAKAHGALQVQSGPRPVRAEVDGRVLEISVRPGEHVAAGQELARIDATELRARVLRQERELELVVRDNAQTMQRATAAHESIARGLKRKQSLLWERVRASGAIVQSRLANERRARAMVEQGVATAADATDAAIASQTSRDQLLTLRQQIVDIDIELAERERALAAERLQLEKAEKQAEAELAQSRTLLELTSVRSPEAGVVESLLVSAGQVLESGAELARVVPVGPLTRVVAFVPAKDASFVREGIRASVEFPSLPVAEFGRVDARVTRVSSDLASDAEVFAVLGTEAPAASLVRVELELDSSETLAAIGPALRSGSRVLARLSTRRVPIAVLLFEFVRRWYPS